MDLETKLNHKFGFDALKNDEDEIKNDTIVEQGYRNGLKYKIVKYETLDSSGQSLSYLCGYIGSKENLKRYEYNISVYGGIAYSSSGNGEILDKGYYWLGFDCMHADDLENKKDINFVRNEIFKCAEQIINLRTIDVSNAIWG